MLVGRAPDIRSSEITDKKLYLRRRDFIQVAAMTAVGAAAGSAGVGRAEALSWPRVKIPVPIQDSGWGKGEKPNSYKDITTYNNFYEFGSEKEDPAANAQRLKTKPWTIKVDGLVARAIDCQLEDLIKPYTLKSAFIGCAVSSVGQW
jgi:methionine sulfoxide reductase catalytic subunit